MIADSLTKITPRPLFEKHTHYIHNYGEWLKDVRMFGPRGQHESEHCRGGADGESLPKIAKSEHDISSD